MPIIFVPLSSEQWHQLNVLVSASVGKSRSDVMRRALDKYSEQEAIDSVLRAQQEPTLNGNLDEILKSVV